jgi:hypothetical protein
MSNSEQKTMPKLYDLTGQLVTDFKTIPSGTTLRNDCGSYFVVSREGDAPQTVRTINAPKCGPMFI